ncbi:MAG: hypothetical protein ACOCP8_09875 [archaeon]
MKTLKKVLILLLLLTLFISFSSCNRYVKCPAYAGSTPDLYNHLDSPTYD